MPRFVIQHHLRDAGDEHWDLMLEVGGTLWTWSLPCPPAALPAMAQQLTDHRLDYLEYEGEISGGRGRVAIHDAGLYEWLGDESAPQTHDTSSVLCFRLAGCCLQGRFELRRIPHEGRDLWRFSRVAE